MINYENPPEKVEIYFSKNKIFLQIFWSISCLVGLIYLFVKHEANLLLILIVVALLFLFFDLRKIFRKTPVLVISKTGILIKEELISWNQIKKYEIIEQNYRRKTYSLNIETFQKSIFIDVDNLTFIPQDIRSLIILYKGIKEQEMKLIS